MSFKNFFGHLHTINHHKLLVMRYCFKAGLYAQGILHDLSKYSPVEFWTGVRYFAGGDKSPNGIERREKGISPAWLHHKGRNKHHFEYWIDYGFDKKDLLIGMRMPDKYIVEMFIDRMCACKNYQKKNYTDKSPLEYYERGKSYLVMHDEVRALLEKLLNMLAERGEEETFSYIRREILKNK